MDVGWCSCNGSCGSIGDRLAVLIGLYKVEVIGRVFTFISYFVTINFNALHFFSTYFLASWHRDVMFLHLLIHMNIPTSLSWILCRTGRLQVHSIHCDLLDSHMTHIQSGMGYLSGQPGIK